MLFSESFNKDIIGTLFIESKSIKIKRMDKEYILKAITGKPFSFISESYNQKINISNISDNIITFNFSEKLNELAEYIIESCDELGYQTISNIDNDNISIKVIRGN
jgi:hypothetical protein